MAVKDNMIKITGKGTLNGYNEYAPMEIELIAAPDRIVNLIIIN